MTTLVETAYYSYLTQVTTTITLEEFTNLLITDDTFNAEWSNGCTRELTFDERYTLGEPIENVRVAKVAKYGEAYMINLLNEFKIPKRSLTNV